MSAFFFNKWMFSKESKFFWLESQNIRARRDCSQPEAFELIETGVAASLETNIHLQIFFCPPPGNKIDAFTLAIHNFEI